MPFTGTLAFDELVATLGDWLPRLLRELDRLLRASLLVLDDVHGIPEFAVDELGLELRNGAGTSGADCARAPAPHSPHRMPVNNIRVNTGP